MFKQNKNKMKISAMLSIFMFSQIFGLFFVVRPVNAQMDAAITSAFVSKWTYDKIESNLTAAALGSLVSGVSYFMRKLAYDGAKYIAAGGKGQKPLVFQDGFGNYIKNVANDSVATAIGEFGTPFGLNLCAPPDIRFQQKLQVSLDLIYNQNGSTGNTASTPNCTWNQFKSSWENIDEMYSGDNLSERFAKSIDVVQGDFGLVLSSMSRLDNLVSASQQAAILERQEGDGFKSISERISNTIKTPASLVKKEGEALTAAEQAKFSAEQVAGLYGTSAWQIIPTSLSIFANTLVSSLMDRILNKGLVPTNEGDALDFYASTINSNRKAAEKAFSFLITGIPQRSLTSYDILTQYSSCPNTPGLNNCVIDTDFVQALSRNSSENYMTIQEALDSGLLHPNWQLVPPTDVVKNTDKDCYLDAYCYSNIQKLRKARILPIGVEIAALKSNPDKPYTLGEVVAGYNECNTSFTPDASKPFCHLIDPNWILKVPEARCEALVNGPQLSGDNTSERLSECADFSTCLAKDSNGQCLSFGYCTKEKNEWTLPGAICPAQYNTCKTYTSEDGVIASYLSRTLEYGNCNIDSVGCTAYSTDKVNGEWKNDNNVNLDLQKNGRQQVLYFNSRVQNYICPESANGCNLFVYPATNKEVYMKKAPDYMSCYDTNLATSEIEWPQNFADLNNLKNRENFESCNAFAEACIPEEVGCEEYRPKDGSATLTAVVGNNYCDSVCIGYDTFKQQESNFEQAEFPLYFIPSQGQSCAPQYAGCTEFTNLSETSGGKLEYYTDIKYCQKTNDNNSKVFYAWEGSDTKGYVLKKYNLLPIKETESRFVDDMNDYGLSGDASMDLKVIGSPAYTNDSIDILNDNYNFCNAQNYNILVHNPYDPNAADPDCREFHDDAGNKYYRLLSETISVSNDCQPLKKTELDLYRDYYLTVRGKEVCESRNGNWQNGSCMLCMNGGDYEVDATGVGSCKYWSIPSEAQSCPAIVNGCRLYVGNTGNNLYEIYNSSFEPSSDSRTALMEAKELWGNGESDNSVSVEPEATQVGLHSLRVNNGSTTLNLSEKLQKGNWYELSFWARGDTNTLNIYFGENIDDNLGVFTRDPLTDNFVPVSIGYEWQEYKLGPVMFNGENEKDFVLWFDRTSGSGNYFLDNVRIVSMSESPDDYVPLIKDSWKTAEGYDVSTKCDSTPLDAYPGEYLGCREYTNRNSQSISVIGFQNLCRAEAVGCVGLVDTNNIKPSTYVGVENVAYNVLCLESAQNVNEKCEVKLDFKEYSCDIAKGEKSCHIVGPVTLNPGTTLTNFEQSFVGNNTFDTAYLDKSTIVIPMSDSENPDLVYLAVKSDKLCSQNYLGCREVGRQVQVLPDADNANSYEFESQFILDNPNNYSTILCTADQKNCSSFKGDNSVSFFKDPLKNNGALCVYKDATQVNGSNVRGWFIDGVGTCSNNINNFCKTSSDCGGAACNNVGNTPCYPNYLNSQGEYGLYSNGSTGYNGLVGSCESSHNLCTELIDPIDNQPYYVINDNRLTAQNDACNGKVSQKEGCVLFNMTENPAKFYDSKATYTNSKNSNYTLVSPVNVSQTTGDTNMIIKVDRNRQCGEWLACRTSKVELDENGNAQELCLEYKSCNKLGADGKCASDGWVDNDNSTKLTEASYISNEKLLQYDYSGYSLFNKYDVSNYVYIQFPKHDDAYLAYQMNDKFFVNEYKVKGCFALNTNGSLLKNDGDICGYDDGGRCYNQKCLYPIETKFTETPDTVTNNNPETISKNVEKMLKYLEHGTCKAYPEKDSPFDAYWAVDDIANTLTKRNVDIKQNSNLMNGPLRYEYRSVKNNFASANICQFAGDTNSECSCDYIKVEYKNGTTDYWPRRANADIPVGICSGTGDKDGEPCEQDSDCTIVGSNNTFGVCNKQKSSGKYIGLKGLCLEYDLSRPLTTYSENSTTYQKFACLTWLPIQVSATAFDIYNSDIEAGYLPERGYDSELGGMTYCAESTSYGLGYYDMNSFGSYYFPSYIQDNPDKITDNRIKNFDIGTTGIDAGYLNKLEYLALSASENDEYRTYFNWNNKVYTNYQNGDVYTYDKSDSEDPYYGLKIEDCNVDEQRFKLLKNINLTYKGLQVWSWMNIGMNSRILRMDREVGCFSGSERDFGFDKYSGADSNTAAVYSFAPNLGLGDNLGDSGTVMHPPFMSITEHVNPPGDSLKNYVSKVNSTSYVYADTSSFSSRLPKYDVTKFFDNIYTDADVESKLRDLDLAKVFFVPLAFPDGAAGPNPSNLTKNFYIDFEYLRNQKNVAINDVPGSGGEKFIAFDDSYPGKLKNFMYKLTRKNSDNNCIENGLLSKCTYENGDDTEKSKIYTRYVTLFYDKDAFGIGHQFNFDSNLQLPTVDNDPFSVTCMKAANNNWLAIGMDFNKDGEFLGYISRFCNGVSGDYNNGIMFATIAQLNDRCTKLVSVVNKYEDLYSSLGYNKAWTNRVWSGAKQGFSDSVPFAKNTSMDPFASLNTGIDVTNDLVLNDNISQLKTGSKYYNFYDTNFGLPYSCTGGSLFDKDNGAIAITTDDSYTYYPPSENFILELNSYDSKLCSSITDPNNRLKEVSKNITDRNKGLANIQKLFKSFYAFWDFSLTTGHKDPNYIDKDVSDIDLGKTQAPSIFALNYNTCQRNNLTAKCLPAAEGFTVGDRNYAYPLDNTNTEIRQNEDKNGDGAIDPIIYKNSYTANTRFFAYADDNRMPIKRVMMNWGDGVITGSDKVGFYKNRKPYCGNESGVGRCTTGNTWKEGDSMLTCKTDSECKSALGSAYKCDTKSETVKNNFGDDDRACESDYVEFSHAYYCDLENNPNTYTLTQIRTNSLLVGNNVVRLFGPLSDPQSIKNAEAAYVAIKNMNDPSIVDDNSKVCIYKPAVQVLDNWGWCNGSCVDGYYKDNNADIKANSTLRNNGCYDNTPVVGFSGGQKQCSGGSNVSGSDPWKYYGGAIIIIP